jgi:hypothetical protein
MAEVEAFELERQLPLPMRFVLGALGLFCILAPALDLGRAFLQIGWWTLFVGIIVIGAWVVGATFVAAAILGETQHWQFGNGELVLSRRSLLTSSIQTIRSNDVARTDIRVLEWDGNANTFSVVLHLKSGRRFETPDYATRAAAEAMRARICRALR